MGHHQQLPQRVRLVGQLDACPGGEQRAAVAEQGVGDLLLGHGVRLVRLSVASGRVVEDDGSGMDGRQLQERAAARAQELPGAEMSHPFGEDWDVHKVAGKVFMLFSQVAGTDVVIVKSAPSDAKALVEGMADITPGYHMNKKHWITLNPGGTGLDEQLVEDLVTESYLLVVEKLPRRLRPVDPETFGQV